MRRIGFLSRPVSGTLLSRPVQLGLARCNLSSSVILHKEPPKGFRNFGSKTPDKGSKKSGSKRRLLAKTRRRESRKETATEPGIYPKIIPFSNPQNVHLYHKTCICTNLVSENVSNYLILRQTELVSQNASPI